VIRWSLLMGLCLLGFPVNGTVVEFEKKLGWTSFRDLNSKQFSQRFSQYSKAGYMMIDIDAYPQNRGLRYSMIWRKNTHSRAWAEHHNLTSAQYSEKRQYYKDRGFRPLDIAAYTSGDQTLYAGIWVENVEKIYWSSHRDLSSTQYGQLLTEKRRAGFRLMDMEVYQTRSGLKYSAIWYKNDGRIWAQLRNLTREQYQAEKNERALQGFLMMDFESWPTKAGKRYAAIWEKKSGYAQIVRTNRSRVAFTNLWHQYKDEGFRLIDFERLGDRYGGIWLENETRYLYRMKSTLDRLVKKYRSDNKLPSIAVAVIHNGNVIYRRGFGFADVAAGKRAHSETVYGAASVSKVIGGTLAAKLEANQELSDGTNFQLNLSDTTKDYLGDLGLPAHHTHTVEQLFSHLGCVAHYSTTPAIANQTNHYSQASDAVQSIWNTGLVKSCKIGRTLRYSTPSFTFVAAVLEQATGRTITQLLNNELFTPHGLNMRVQFATSTPPSNYDRAVPYYSINKPVSYSNNSWKVLGGGIETSTYQLARFGWKVLKGEIVSPNVRDNRLWNRVNPSQRYGLGWSIGSLSRNSRRVAEGSGLWTGARSFLRVYRDDNLVIGVMSNRRDHRVDDVDGLTDNLADIILNQGIKLGKTATELDSRKKTVCTGEAAIGNLIADAMRDGVNADIGITNGGGIRSKKIYAPGTTITRRDILTELPFRNVVVKLGLTGAQIWQALENGVSRIEKIAGSYKYSKNPGRFPQVSGMSFIWNPKAKAGSRIVSVKVGGKTLNMSYIYTVATNEYMARGGDGYSIFKKGSVLIGSKSATLLTSMVMDYIIAKGTVSPKVEGRIVAK